MPPHVQTRRWRTTAVIAGMSALSVLGGTVTGSPAAFANDPLPVGSEEQDTSGPVLASFSLAPTSVDVRTADATISASAQIKDDVSGVDQLSVRYRSPSGQQSLWFQFGSQSRTAGDHLDGTYTATVLVDTQRESGTWTVAGVTTKDAVGNTREYTVEQARELGAQDITVQSNRDATPPTLRAVRITPSTLDVSGADATPTVEWDVADEGGSGAQYANISISSPSGRQRISAQGYTSTPQAQLTLTGQGMTSTWTPTGNWFEDGLSRYSEPGDWTINWVQVMDKAGNRKTYQGTELTALMSSGSLSYPVVADPVDTADPVVKAYRLSPSSIDVTSAAQNVRVEFDVADELAGVQAAWLTLQSPTIDTASPKFLQRSAVFHQYLTAPRILDGTVVGNITFPRYDRSGDWSVYELCVVDRVKHQRCYSGTALTGLGPTNLKVVTNEPPAVTVTGVTSGGSYESDPVVGCEVEDVEDGVITGVAPTVTGPDADGLMTATCTYTDTGGKTGTHTVPYTVTRTQTQPAVVTACEPTVAQPVVPVGSTVSATATTSGDVATATLDWGDGTPATTGTGAISASHTYATAGVYILTCQVTGQDGGVSKLEYRYVVVYDPSAGFVTGGGWFSSPVGAYTADASLTGRANFGFVSKYKKGATAPTGQTEFEFQAGGLKFHSASYEWLVVSGARAQYKGTGTVNGVGGYAFMLSTVDGQLSGGGGSDTLRMKVWEQSTGKVVYDNLLSAGDDAVPTTTLGGGQIQIHKG